jgi:TrmH family RNA methyltransferase
VYLHGVRDPGNVGAVLRSALAFGAAGVVLGPECADPFGPKAVRASMGAVFAVPLAKAESMADLPGATVALVPGQGIPLAELMRSGPEGWDRNASVPPPVDITILIGAEREGLPPAIVQAADHVAHIPIAADSLNAAMAATVALYELTRMAAG